MTKLNHITLKALAALATGARRESGQSALEYIAIAVALIILVFVGFKALGGNISQAATNLISCATQGKCSGL